MNRPLSSRQGAVQLGTGLSFRAIALLQGLHKNMIKHVCNGFQVDGLDDVPVHAVLKGFPPILFKGVCRHGNDGDVSLSVVWQGADFPRCRIAVHSGHLDVHQHQVIGILWGIIDDVHRFDAVPGASREYPLANQKKGALPNQVMR